MRTHTAPWDYERLQKPATYNDTCPVCGHLCYSGIYLDSSNYERRLYSCPDCGAFKQVEIERLRSERQAHHEEKKPT